jgi:hypothetical protein
LKLGDGIYKRFGEITIRVEDFQLRRTSDRSVPGSEVPAEPLKKEESAFQPDSESHSDLDLSGSDSESNSGTISVTDSPPFAVSSPIDYHYHTASAYARPYRIAKMEAFVSVKTYYGRNSIIVDEKRLSEGPEMCFYTSWFLGEITVGYPRWP